MEAVTQLVESRDVTPVVTGSNPVSLPSGYSSMVELQPSKLTT